MSISHSIPTPNISELHVLMSAILLPDRGMCQLKLKKWSKFLFLKNAKTDLK